MKPSVFRVAAVLATVILSIWWALRERPDPEPAWAVQARARLVDEFSGGHPTEAAYVELVRYLISGFMQFRTPEGSMAAYPGLPSSNGEQSDRLEGFARIAPLMAAWVKSGRGQSIELDDGSEVDLVLAVSQAIASGTDPNSAGYWGTPKAFDQRIVESADIARSLWLLRTEVWDAYPATVKQRIVEWLSAAEGAQGNNNNWLLMQETTAEVIASLTGLPKRPTDRLARIKSFKTADGWFADGPGGEVDYYNAWSFQYEFFWQRQINPAAWPLEAGDENFLRQFQHLITPAGYPVFGRSICYRGAVPVPVIAASLERRDGVTPMLARRTLDATWSYFIPHGMLERGNITQGYCGADPRVVDPYSGPASCLWSARSLVLAFLTPQGQGLWGGPGDARLPVESGTFEIPIPALSATAFGDADGNVRIVRSAETQEAASFDQSVRLWVKTLVRELQITLGLPATVRPRLSNAYNEAEYASNKPFCGCKQ
ncbi:MAG: DUF2264 domain-containing protein [Hyphomicrobiales bacterium]